MSEDRSSAVTARPGGHLLDREEMDRFLAAAAESVDEGVLIWNADGRCVMRNSQLLSLIGIGRGDLPIGMTRAEFRAARVASGHLSAGTAEQFAEAIAAGKGFDFDTTLPSGQVIQTRSRPMPNGGWVSTLADVTERRDMERERALLSGRLDTVLASMEQGIVVWDGAARCLMRNARFHELLEIPDDFVSPGDARGPFLEGLGARGGSERSMLGEIDALFASGRPFTFDRTTPSGRILQSHARPMEGGGHIVTLTDVSEERRVTDEIKRLGEEAARARAEAQEALARELRRREETRLSGQVDEWLQTCRTEAELCRVLERALIHAFPETRGAAYLGEAGVLSRVLAWGGAEGDMDRIEADDCWALRRGRRYQFAADEIGLPCRHVPAGDRALNAICLPIVSRGRTLGAVHLRLPGRAATEEEIDEGTVLVTRIVEHFGMAIANLRGRESGHAPRAGDTAARAAI